MSNVQMLEAAVVKTGWLQDFTFKREQLPGTGYLVINSPTGALPSSLVTKVLIAPASGEETSAANFAATSY